VGACSLRGAEGIAIAADTRLKLPPQLVFIPREEALLLIGERPGGRVLGAVLTTDEAPRVLVIYDRGERKVDFVGWNDAGTELATRWK
jgi:uncharacterized membrane-anchored protein